MNGSVFPLAAARTALAPRTPPLLVRPVDACAVCWPATPDVAVGELEVEDVEVDAVVDGALDVVVVLAPLVEADGVDGAVCGHG